MEKYEHIAKCTSSINIKTESKTGRQFEINEVNGV